MCLKDLINWIMIYKQILINIIYFVVIYKYLHYRSFRQQNIINQINLYILMEDIQINMNTVV